MAVSTASNIDDIEFEWYSTHLTTKQPAQAPLIDRKRAYWAEKVGTVGQTEAESELELRWLRTLTGVSKAHNDLDRAWREAVVGAGRTPQPSTLANKILYFTNVA